MVADPPGRRGCNRGTDRPAGLLELPASATRGAYAPVFGPEKGRPNGLMYLERLAGFLVEQLERRAPGPA